MQTEVIFPYSSVYVSDADTGEELEFVGYQDEPGVVERADKLAAVLASGHYACAECNAPSRNRLTRGMCRTCFAAECR